jgi:predicted transposase YbfD/YdcC
MPTTVRPLAEYLTALVDPRKPKGLRHQLVAILCLCVVAMLCGAKTPKAIAQWWKNRPDPKLFLERLGFTHAYGPGKSTLYRVLALVTVEAFITQVNCWLAENFPQLFTAEPNTLDGVSIDGKTLRGSRKQGAVNTHLLSAFSHRLRCTFAQLGVDDKTNEIGAMPDMLADLVIAGHVFTMDALLTQRDIAETIVENKGDYVMIAKDNQPTLRADIATLFEPEHCMPGFSPPPKDLREETSINKGHGRLEYRTLQASTALNEYLDWPGVHQVFRLARKTIILKTGEVRQETVYGLTSLPPARASAAQLLHLTRAHWGIENRSHWVRDVTFGEDQSQVRKGTLPQMMAALRTCVIGLFHLCKFRWVPDGFDFFAARPMEALATLGC